MCVCVYVREAELRVSSSKLQHRASVARLALYRVRRNHEPPPGVLTLLLPMAPKNRGGRGRARGGGGGGRDGRGRGGGGGRGGRGGRGGQWPFVIGRGGRGGGHPGHFWPPFRLRDEVALPGQQLNLLNLPQLGPAMIRPSAALNSTLNPDYNTSPIARASQSIQHTVHVLRCTLNDGPTDRRTYVHNRAIYALISWVDDQGQEWSAHVQVCVLYRRGVLHLPLDDDDDDDEDRPGPGGDAAGGSGGGGGGRGGGAGGGAEGDAAPNRARV